MRTIEGTTSLQRQAPLADPAMEIQDTLKWSDSDQGARAHALGLAITMVACHSWPYKCRGDYNLYGHG